jgi:diguanylate cyclase (GGDEF)-like protein/PAS domain S-box-containing protein
VGPRSHDGWRLLVLPAVSALAAGDHAPVHGLGWTVSATLPMSTVTAPAQAFGNSLLLALGSAYLILLVVLGYAVVITRRRAGERAVVAVQAGRLAALFAASPVGIIEGMPDGTILAVNDALAEMLDYSADELLGVQAGELADPSSAADVAETMGGVLDGSVASYRAERVYRKRSGAPVPVLVSVVVLRGATGTLDRMVAFVSDLTGLRQAEVALRSSEERFRRVFDEGLIGRALTAETGVIIRANHALATCLGCAADELRGRQLSSCFEAEEDRITIAEVVASKSREMYAEVPLRGSTGAQLWGRVAVHWVLEPNNEWVLLAQFEDVTARRIAEQRLRDLALHDDLTGLPNRRLLMERCDQVFAVARTGRTGTSVTALFLDLDGFKTVNDRVGHQVGDRVLSSIAADLQGTLRPADTLARVGGDEFVVLLGTDDGLEAGRVVADRLADLVRRQIPCGEQTLLPVSASIGIAHVDLSVEPEIVPEQLLRRADAAMYRAKERGRDRHEVFDSELLADTEARYELEQAVRDGLRHDRVSLVFQSVVDIDSGAVLGAEALMRLHDETGRLLPTLPAIMAAEQAGLASELGDRVMELALDASHDWPAHMTIAVNVSARELTGNRFRERVEEALGRHDVDPTRLVLEVTESSILQAGRASLGALQALRELGVRIAIDDFGTAYATLQNLTVLPVDVIKVDASFTAGLDHDRTATAVVHGILTMAEAMEVPCIVEGIESQSQHDALVGLGVHGQGWLWGKPRGREVTPSVPNQRAGPAPTRVSRRGLPLAGR